MRRQEEAMRIMEALSGVDEELLARCGAADTTGMAGAGADTAGSLRDAGRLISGKERRRGSRAWQYLSRCAAALALVMVGAASWRGLRMSKDMALNESASGVGPEMAAMDFALNLELEEGLSGDEGDGTLPVPAVAGSGIDDGNGMGSADGSNAPVSSNDTYIGVTEKKRDEDGLKEDLQDGIPSAAQTLTEKEAVQTMTEKEARQTLVEKEAAQTMTEKEARQTLTEDEARQINLLGDYVPTALPEGCAFEAAQYEEETGRLTVWWEKGMDDIILSIEQADSGAAFSGPVFAKDDFSLEIVRSCVLSYSGDSGDDSTPRGQFSVLYDGVLVCFNGKGTPEEIWEMFTSIAKQ